MPHAFDVIAVATIRSVETRMNKQLLLALLIVTFTAHATEPCASPLQRFPEVIPQDGATNVPTNVIPLVRDENSAGLVLALANGQPIASLARRFTVTDGMSERPYLRLEPEAELPPDTTIVVVDGDLPIATFRTGAGRDDVPPSAPIATFIGHYSDGACDPYAMIEVSGDDDTTFFLAFGRRTDDGEWPAPVAIGASVTRELVVGGEAESEARVHVVAIDAAGNAGPSVEVRVDFPPAHGVSCAALHTSRGTAVDDACLSIVALLVALKRRRREARRA